MELNFDSSERPVRDAASVVLLRDGAAGLEVFLVKRHGLSDVLGGVYVFPGGKVDAEDSAAALQSRVDASPESLRRLLGEDALDERGATALFVAATREAFEETGVLFAQSVTGFDAARAWRLLREGQAFDEVVTTLSARLQADALHPWSRWITPAVGGVMRKRFDTRFFLARLPDGQVAHHDEHEAVDSVWLTPREALERYWVRDIELAPPQIMSLAHLSRHADVASALAQARSRTPPLIQPEHFEHDGTKVICYPGDERHSVCERALPGPTRLHYRKNRFEPEAGFEALFG